MHKDKSLAALNALVPIEERPILDAYIDLLLQGDSRPFKLLSSKTNVKETELAMFLNTSPRRAYVQSKLQYLLDCAEIDRLRVLQETRELAYFDPHTLLEETTRRIFNRGTGQTEEVTEIGLKPLDRIPPQAWKGIQKLKYDAFGRPDISFHNRLPALQLLAKLQDLHKIKGVEDKRKKPKGLFSTDLRDAKDPEEKKEVSDIIDVDFEDIQRTRDKIVRATEEPAELLTEDEQEEFSADNMYGDY